MATRAMNNTEKAKARILKQNGFEVFFEYSGPGRGSYWAKHPKLICQYCIVTAADEAIKDLSEKQPTQTTLFNQ